MNAVFRALGISKQGFHQRMDLYMLQQEEYLQLKKIVEEIRLDHPCMSSREMYRLIKPSHMGRDKFEAFCFAHGFKVELKRSFHRTTNSLGVTRFENLLIGFELNSLNQVWVSDITFYRIGDSFYYITFIMDLFSRRIIGHSAALNLLTATTTIPALKMALSLRKDGSGVIFHSDGGGQYYCKEFISLLRNNKIKSSMCESVYENAHAERVNGTIKNNYLKFYQPESFAELIKKLNKAVDMYNQRSHSSLKKVSPVNFEDLSTKLLVINKRKKEAKKEKNDSNNK